MRVGIFVVSAILGGAGVAFAQSDWVVDPWAPSANATARVEKSASLPAPSRSLDVSEGWIDERNFELTDPWLSSTPSSLGASSPAPISGARRQPALPPASRESRDWAKPVPLLVDPWAPEPTKAWVPAPDLIVDPWANEVSGS